MNTELKTLRTRLRTNFYSKAQLSRLNDVFITFVTNLYEIAEYIFGNRGRGNEL